MPKLNQQGAIQFIILILLVAGLAVGIYLVQQTQIFKPKAGGESVEWVPSQNDPENCVTTKEDGTKVTTCPKVKLKITVPEQVTQ